MMKKTYISVVLASLCIVQFSSLNAMEAEAATEAAAEDQLIGATASEATQPRMR